MGLGPAGKDMEDGFVAKMGTTVASKCDENKKVTQDFKCDRNLLLTHMKYFEKYLLSD